MAAYKQGRSSTKLVDSRVLVLCVVLFLMQPSGLFFFIFYGAAYNHLTRPASLLRQTACAERELSENEG